MKILFTTDLEGNMWKYKQLIAAAEKHQPDIVIDGGDMLPGSSGMVGDQGKFIQNQLAGVMKSLSDLHIVYLCNPGNHDEEMFDPVFEETCSKFPNVFFMDKKKVKIEKYEFIGMSWIVDYPFGNKNRCRRDTKEYKAKRSFEKPVLMADNGLVEVKDWVKRINTLPTIEDELKELVRPEKMGNAIYVMHMPPARVGLAGREDNKEAGSQAIYEFLLANQPKMSFHGHAHSSPELSGKWKARIDNTISIQPGQLEDDFTYVVVDIDKKEYERFKV